MTDKMKRHWVAGNLEDYVNEAHSDEVCSLTIRISGVEKHSQITHQPSTRRITAGQGQVEIVWMLHNS